MSDPCRLSPPIRLWQHTSLIGRHSPPMGNVLQINAGLPNRRDEFGMAWICDLHTSRLEGICSSTVARIKSLQPQPASQSSS